MVIFSAHTGVLRICAWFLCAVLIGLSGGCAVGDASKNDMATRWLKAQAARDVSTLWELLAAEDMERVRAVYAELRRLDADISAAYPKATRTAVRVSTGVDVLDSSDDATALFAAFVAQSGEPQVLSAFQELGLRGMRNIQTDEGVTVQTLGGDTVLIVDDPSGQRIGLSEEDRQRLSRWLADLQRQRQALRQQLRAVDSRRL